MKNKIAALAALALLAGCTTPKTVYVPQGVFPHPPVELMAPPEDFKTIEMPPPDVS